MADTQQGEENSFIAWLKWLLGLDEELEKDNHNNIEEVKKRYKEITGRNDLEMISKLQDIENLKDRKSEIVKDTKINEIPLQLFEDIKEMENDIKKDEKSIEDKKGEINKFQETYNKAKEDHDYKIAYNEYKKSVKDNKENITHFDRELKTSSSRAKEPISIFIEAENNYRTNGVQVIENDKLESYNKVNDYLKIRNSAKSGEEINDEFFRRNGFTDEQINNYNEINGLDKDQKDLLDNYLNNREELQKALEEKQNLDNQAKDYEKEPSTKTLDELKQEMGNANSSIKQLKGEIDALKKGVENKKNEIDNKIVNEVGVENLNKVLLAKRTMDLNPNIGVKNALDMAENYKTPFLASGKEKRAAKDMEKAKKEMDKRVNKGLCGNSDKFRENLERRMAEMKREFPFKTEEQGQLTSLCTDVFVNYKQAFDSKKNPTVDEQYKMAKEALEKAINDNKGKYSEDVIKALAYKIDKDEKAYKESKRAYINATKQRAAYGAERIAKNNQKNKEKEAKQERRKTRIQAIKDIGGDIKNYLKKVGELRKANKRLKKCKKAQAKQTFIDLDVKKKLEENTANAKKALDTAKGAHEDAKKKVTEQAWLKTFKDAGTTYDEKKGKLECKKNELSDKIEIQKGIDSGDNNMGRKARKFDVKNVKSDSKKTAAEVAKQFFDGGITATKSDGKVVGNNNNLPNVQVKNENWRNL